MWCTGLCMLKNKLRCFGLTMIIKSKVYVGAELWCSGGDVI